MSYSLTGDRGPAGVTNSNAIISSYNPFRPFTSVQESGLTLYQLENSELTYEKKHELNLGLDLGFINNRINVTMDWYTRNNFDLIGYINTQGVGGETRKLANVASMKSHGFELSVSSLNIANKNFSWNTDFIFSTYKNEVTELDATVTLMDYVSGTGFTMPGYPSRSLKYEGSTDPTISGSLGNTLTYKGFRLNVFFTFSGGNVVRLDPVFSARYTDLTATTREFKNRWTLPGDEHRTNIPAILSYRQYYEDTNLQYAYNAYNYSTERVAKGGFVRLKEISCSYDFPKKLISPLKLSSLSLKLQATNLCLLYADKKLNGQDPEFINAGGVASPVPRQFTLTLRLGI